MAGGWTHPGGYGSQQTYPNTFNSSYSRGIHNPVFDDNSTFNPPVPHQEPGGITTRRNSRPRNPSVEGYPPSNTFQGQGYVPSPSFQATDTVGTTGRGQPIAGSYRVPEAQFLSVQPPVNIFTPDFSQQLATGPPPTSGVAFGSESTISRPGTQLAPVIPPISSPAWNDPPPMQPLPSKPKAEGSKTVAAPITQPLMQVPGTEILTQPVTGPGGLPPPMAGNYSAPYGNAYVSTPPSTSDINGQFPPQGAYEWPIKEVSVVSDKYMRSNF